MNEPKRRGRPPKAETLAKLVDAINPSNVHSEADAMYAAQAYASRIWSGQSPDVPRRERLKRIAAALEAQGLSMEGVEL